MKKISKIFFALPALMLALTSCHSSKNAAGMNAAVNPGQGGTVVVQEMSSREAEKVMTSAVDQYTPWVQVTLNGKLSMKGLPLDPTAKIFMERGSSILISVRAPIVGEVARIEIADGEILLLNRMKKTCARESLDKFLSKIDMTLEDVQDIFLGRMFLLGQGTLSKDNMSGMNVARLSSEGWMVEPAVESAIASYYFTLADDLQLSALCAESAGGTYKATAYYKWKNEKGKKDIELQIAVGDKAYAPVFSLDAPDYEAKPMARASLGSGWTEVPVAKFMTSF